MAGPLGSGASDLAPAAWGSQADERITGAKNVRKYLENQPIINDCHKKDKSFYHMLPYVTSIFTQLLP